MDITISLSDRHKTGTVKQRRLKLRRPKNCVQTLETSCHPRTIKNEVQHTSFSYNEGEILPIYHCRPINYDLLKPLENLLRKCTTKLLPFLMAWLTYPDRKACVASEFMTNVVC